MKVPTPRMVEIWGIGNPEGPSPGAVGIWRIGTLSGRNLEVLEARVSSLLELVGTFRISNSRFEALKIPQL